jgi:hypothetical protein
MVIRITNAALDKTQYRYSVYKNVDNNGENVSVTHNNTATASNRRAT